jgi:hypothetical protein
MGSKRPSLGYNGVHVVWWIGLSFRLLGARGGRLGEGGERLGGGGEELGG